MSNHITIPCNVITNHPNAEGGSVRWDASAERVGDDVMLIHNAIPQLEGFTKLAEGHAELFTSSSVVGEDLKEYANPEHRNSDVIRLGGDACPDDLIFYDLLCHSVESGFIRAYMDRVNPRAVVNVGSGYTLLRYREGGFFKEHVDVTRDHPVLGHRRLSVVIFCNDNFEGGDLVFPRQGLTIKPEAGQMVIFPSGFTHPHEVEPITGGTRYSIVSWFF